MKGDELVASEPEIVSQVEEDSGGGIKANPMEDWFYNLADVYGDNPDEISELQVVVLTYDGGSPSGTAVVSQVMPFPKSGQAGYAMTSQGKTISSNTPYVKILPSECLSQFENDHRWTIRYSPEAVIETLVQKNYLPPYAFSSTGHPIARQILLGKINQHPHFDETPLTWRGEPQDVGNIPNDYYTRRLHKALGNDDVELGDAQSSRAEHLRSEYTSMDRSELIEEVVEKTDVDDDEAQILAQSALADELVAVEVGDDEEPEETAPVDVESRSSFDEGADATEVDVNGDGE